MTTSLYIHWPFCESKCPYCDFNSHVREKVEYERWLKGYLREIEFYVSEQKENISSIFFGGGTPSLMRPEMVSEILAKVKKEFIVRDDIEITLEANPSSYETEKFKSFKQAGINRVSIGVQSFDENNLKFLGRKHDRKQAIQAIESAGNIFGNFSFDLIYALPNQNVKSWDAELDMALKFGSPHISLYQLTIEKGTPFYSDHQKGKFALPEEDVQTELYNMTVEKCAAKGMARYEVSNFAKPGHESRHNLNYWRYNNYIGIGPGAHGRVMEGKDKVETMDIHHPENWLETVELKGHGLQSKKIMTRKEILEELLFMGLRIREGISLEKFKVLGFEFDEIIDKKLSRKICDEGLMVIDNECIRLTDKGLLLHNNIVKKLLG